MTPVALVTGASRGIGRAVALELAAAGYAIVANYRQAADAALALQKAITERGGTCELARADVSVSEDRQALLAFCRERMGRLDLLVNNAGVGPEKRLDVLEATEESWDRVLNINLKGPYFLTQAAACWMLEQVRAGTLATGRIVFISSVSAFASSINRGEYCVSKAGLSMASAVWAHRLAGTGVVVFEVRPGIIDTDMITKVREDYVRRIAAGLIPQNRFGRPEDVAQAVRAIAEGRFDYATGAVLDVSGGFQLHRL